MSTDPDIPTITPPTLADLKVGDKVIVVCSGFTQERTVATVVKAFKAYVILDDEEDRKWRRSDGHYVGSTGYHRPRIQPATPELIAAVNAENHKAKLVNRLRYHTDWGNVSITALERIVALLPVSTPTP